MVWPMLRPGTLGMAMNALVTAAFLSYGFSLAPVSAPYGFVEVGHLAVLSDRSVVEISQVAPYAPYSLTCRHSAQTVTISSADGAARQITVNRC
jgi:hypothetical protein